MDAHELVVFHIGGGDDDIGPTQALFKLPGVAVRLYVFEIIEDDGYTAIKRSKEFDRAEAEILPIGIGENDGEEVDFKVNLHPLSSSVLRGSWKVAHNDPSYPGIRDWGENTEVERSFKATLRSIDSLVAEGVVPAPDFLSMDIQGLELAALRGARRSIQETVVGVVCESEFTEIYENQGLFHQQLSFLEGMSMRFVDFLTRQNWFVGRPVGEGFFTVAESLFLKHVHPAMPLGSGGRANLDENTVVSPKEFGPARLLKLALVSFAFSRFGYFLMLFSVMNAEYPSECKEMRGGELEPYFIIWESLERGEDWHEEDPPEQRFETLVNSIFPGYFHVTEPMPNLSFIKKVMRALRQYWRQGNLQ